MDLKSTADKLVAGYELITPGLFLSLDGFCIHIRSNSAPLLEQLGNYFAYIRSQPETADIEIIAIDRDPPELNIDFVDWKREAGKSGRKDSYYDLAGGRLVRKVRTGMVFLQSRSQRIAAGPCCIHDNQVINFINAQYMNWLQNQGWLICHASGLQFKDQGLGIAGFSGGGKSTLMLKLLENDNASYLTNDRLFVRNDNAGVIAAGIAKLPRVNPGTIVHNPRLHRLITENRRKEYLALPPEELWELEEKYDVMIEEVYGAGKIVQRSRLDQFIILNWRRNSRDRLSLKQVELEQRPDLLRAIMKSSGPFYQYADGSFFQDTAEPADRAYLDIFRNIKVHEASGATDFELLCKYCLELFNA